MAFRDLYRLTLSLAVLLTASCATTVSRFDASATDGVQLSYEQGRPILSARDASAEILVAPPATASSVGKRLQLHVLIENVGADRLDVDPAAFVATIGGVPAKLISAEQRVAEIHRREAWEQIANALSAGAEAYNAEQAATSRVEGSVYSGGRRATYSATVTDRAAADALRRQAAHDAERRAVLIDAQARAESAETIDQFLGRNTLEPGESVLGLVMLEASSSALPRTVELVIPTALGSHRFSFVQRAIGSGD